jgi:DNA-binding transcriptional LysR family regulator
MSSAYPPASGDLAAFVRAVETGTVQGAADSLHLTQSAVTKRLQALERRLGAQLLARGRLGVTPTPAGERVYAEAKIALVALARVEEATRSRGGGVRAAASHTIGEILLPTWLSAFRLVAPGVRPQVAIVNSARALDALREGAADIAFVEDDVEDQEEFESLLVGEDAVVVVVAAEHRWARRRAVRARELPTEPYAAREAGSGTRMVADHALAERGVTLTPAVESASAESLKRIVRSGGFTLLSELVVQGELGAGALAVVPLADARIERRLRALRSARSSHGADRLWSWLREHVALA